uniref:Selenoprotein O n=1 Tax=Octactis speculum TaxID=3111310 RepID=A0A7S2CL70_9STRA
MAAEIGLDDEACTGEAFLRLFSGDMTAAPGMESWCTPYALSIMGQPYYNNCPFGNGNGYGDGRAISVGEVIGVESRWELQLKGAGRTPFCRGGDGRAVLRSSIREFLVSEAMHNLRVPTTRALSLIVSEQETVLRPWYSGARNGRDPDVMVEENCAITCRVSPSFMRVGHVDLFSRRVSKALPFSPAQKNAMQELNDIVSHLVSREFPHLRKADTEDDDDDDASSSALTAPLILELLEESAERISHMCSSWLRVGFCQGNFNGDNCLIGGRTMDYGPFGFLDHYDPRFAKWTGSGSHFAFANQPNAGFANWQTLAEALLPLFLHLGGTRREMKDLVARTPDVFVGAMNGVWRSKLGFKEPTGSMQLFAEFEEILRRTRADYTIAWRQLANVVDAAQSDVISGYDDPSLVARLDSAFFGQEQDKLLLDGGAQDGTAEKKAAFERDLAVWIKAWLSALAEESSGLVGVADRLRQENPKFIPREWMLVDAYDAAAKGDMSVIIELHELFETPYAEHTTELTNKYYRRASPEVLNRPGTAFMT